MDKEKRTAVVALHKCGIEKAHNFELLKPLNITSVFVYRTVKLFFEMGGVSECKRSSQSHVVHTPQVINVIRSRINKIRLQNKKLWLRKWIFR